MTSLLNSHDNVTPKTGPCSAKEASQEIVLPGSMAHLASDTFQREMIAHQEAAVKNAQDLARKINRQQTSLDNSAAIEIQRRHAERINRALANSMAPLYNQIDYSAALRSVHAAMEHVAKVVKPRLRKLI